MNLPDTDVWKVLAEWSDRRGRFNYPPLETPPCRLTLTSTVPEKPTRSTVESSGDSAGTSLGPTTTSDTPRVRQSTSFFASEAPGQNESGAYAV